MLQLFTIKSSSVLTFAIILAIASSEVFTSASLSTELLLNTSREFNGITKTKQLKKSSYGLGLPKTAGVGGSARVLDDGVGGFESSGTTTTIPILALMVPEDGAKTSSARPTFYWYVFGGDINYKATFNLYEDSSTGAKSVYQLESNITKGGLYKLTLPTSVPALEANKAQRWTVKIQNQNDVPISVDGLIAFTSSPADVSKSLEIAATELAKARIYADNGYWYDALNAYYNWIIANPNDKDAVTELTAMLKEGFKDHQKLNFNVLVNRIKKSSLQRL